MQFKQKFSIILFLLISFSAFSQIAEQTRKGNKFALVIIDMQPYFIERGGNHTKPNNITKINQILDEQVTLIRKAKQIGMPVIVVEYDLSRLNLKEGVETNSKLKSAIGNYKNTTYFIKNEDGMFSSSNVKKLTNYLSENQIGKLIITGANGGACVEASISGALRNNYDVIAYSKGIADFNYQGFIYPYEYGEGAYNYRTSKCTNCSFKEFNSISEFDQLIREIGRKNFSAKNNAGRNNSLRQIPAKEIPEQNIKSSKDQQVSDQ